MRESLQSPHHTRQCVCSGVRILRISAFWDQPQTLHTTRTANTHTGGRATARSTREAAMLSAHHPRKLCARVACVATRGDLTERLTGGTRTHAWNSIRTRTTFLCRFFRVCARVCCLLVPPRMGGFAKKKRARSGTLYSLSEGC